MKYLSLGYNCQTVATIYKISKLNMVVNPFQNMVTHDLSKLLKLFNNNFDNFFEEVEVERFDDNYLKVKDISNEITSVHNFRYFVDYSLIKNKLKKECFNTINQIKIIEEPLFVFRKNHTFEPFNSSMKLYEYISFLRDKKPFALTIFQQNQEFTSNFENLHFINDKEWKYSATINDWMGDHLLWEKHIKFLWNRTYCL